VQVQRSWLVLNATCAEAEGQLAALATWAATQRAPSAASVAAVALHYLRQHASAPAGRLASAGMQAGVQAAKRSGAFVANQVARGVQWISHAQGYMHEHMPHARTAGAAATSGASMLKSLYAQVRRTRVLRRRADGGCMLMASAHVSSRAGCASAVQALAGQWACQ
jgi:hypothetical protein